MRLPVMGDPAVKKVYAAIKGNPIRRGVAYIPNMRVRELP